MRINSASGGCTWMSSIIWRGSCTASYFTGSGLSSAEFAVLVPLSETPAEKLRARDLCKNWDGIGHGCHTWLPRCSSGDSSAEAGTPTMPADPWSSSPTRGASDY